VRQLTKGPEPAVLIHNAANWTAAYAEAIASQSPAPNPWRNTEILGALAEETYRKCAYCEGIIADVSHPHVEHIIPKSARPDLVVAWINLTLACQVCNNCKGSYYAEDAPLLHPYDDDPASHLAFRGPALFANLGDAKGERTVTRLRLMRPALLAERLKRLQALHELLERWHAATGPDRPMREQLVRDAIAEDQEFSACLRNHAQSAGFPT